jgi:hypothetical protein
MAPGTAEEELWLASFVDATFESALAAARKSPHRDANFQPDGIYGSIDCPPRMDDLRGAAAALQLVASLHSAAVEAWSRQQAAQA